MSEKGVLLDRQAAGARSLTTEFADVKPHARAVLLVHWEVVAMPRRVAVCLQQRHILQAGCRGAAEDIHFDLLQRVHAPGRRQGRQLSHQPLRESVAKVSTKGLANWLVAVGFAEEALPDLDHKPEATAKIQASTPPREELLQQRRSFVVNNPPRVMSSQQVCVPFACKGMMDTIRRYGDSIMKIFVDTKHSCMARGWAVLTAASW